MRAWVVLALCLTLFAGCLQAPVTPLPDGATGSSLEMPLPVHVVAAGFDQFDEASLLANVQPLLPQFQWVRAGTTGGMAPEPLQYKVTYKVHHAPLGFATALFEYAKTVSRADQPDRFLANYDARGDQRICTPSPSPVSFNVMGQNNAPTCKDILRIDAEAIEAWIAEHRAEYGLDFGSGQTIFLLDSYTQGLLDPASYHQYEVQNPAQTGAMRNMRAWGGAYDFVFLDVGAAPNPFDLYPYGSYGPGAPDLSGVRDGPIWEMKGASRQFYANLGRDVSDAVRMLWARDPIYPFEYAERYVLPFYVFIDPNAHTNPDSPLARINPSDVPANTDEAGILKAFQDLVPWANVTVEFHYVYLPNGDPAVQEVLKDAKNRYGKGDVDFGIVKRYFREHWSEYVPNVTGARVYPTFAFLLDAPSNGIYAYSDGDEMGHSWGVFFNVADMACMVTVKVPPGPCYTEDVFGGETYWWAWWNAVLLHELGHSFGLTHTHDTPGLATGGQLTYDLNWLWDSTASSMTYRHNRMGFDAFDKELVWRNHAVNLALSVLDSPTASKADTELARAALSKVAAGDAAGALAEARAVIESLPLQPLVKGTRGTTEQLSFEVRATTAPVGLLNPTMLLPGMLPTVGATQASQRFQIPLPQGATAFELQVREGDAPTRNGWAAYVLITDAGGNPIGGLFNNGYDIGVWEALDKCLGTCQGILVPYGGAKSSYEVTVTPLFGSAPWPKA